jgi:hypothetical protein
LSAIGTVIAFFGAILLAIVGFVWYPVKRLLRARRERHANQIEQKNDGQINDAEVDGAIRKTQSSEQSTERV